MKIKRKSNTHPTYCQYQCNWLRERLGLRYDLLCVEWDVKHYTLTHSPLMEFGPPDLLNKAAKWKFLAPPESWHGRARFSCRYYPNSPHRWHRYDSLFSAKNENSVPANVVLYGTKPFSVLHRLCHRGFERQCVFSITMLIAYIVLLLCAPWLCLPWTYFYVTD